MRKDNASVLVCLLPSEIVKAPLFRVTVVPRPPTVSIACGGELIYPWQWVPMTVEQTSWHPTDG